MYVSISTAAPTARHSARGFAKRLNDLIFLLILEGQGLRVVSFHGEVLVALPDGV